MCVNHWERFAKGKARDGVRAVATNTGQREQISG
jgi:hypothetical protein